MTPTLDWTTVYCDKERKAHPEKKKKNPIFLNAISLARPSLLQRSKRGERRRRSLLGAHETFSPSDVDGIFADGAAGGGDFVVKTRYRIRVRFFSKIRKGLFWKRAFFRVASLPQKLFLHFSILYPPEVRKKPFSLPFPPFPSLLRSKKKITPLPREGCDARCTELPQKGLLS